MALRVHVGVDTDRDRGLGAKPGGDRLQPLELGGRFDVEAEDAGLRARRRMSSRDFATPENTMRRGSPPAISTRPSSPPETMSKPAPLRASRFSTARFEFAFTA